MSTQKTAAESDGWRPPTEDETIEAESALDVLLAETATSPVAVNVPHRSSGRPEPPWEEVSLAHALAAAIRVNALVNWRCLRRDRPECEGCGARGDECDDPRMTWDCEHDRRRWETALSDLGFPPESQDPYTRLALSEGCYCDCEILLNCWPALKRRVGESENGPQIAIEAEKLILDTWGAKCSLVEETCTPAS